MNQYTDIPDFILSAISDPALRQSEEFQQWLQENQENHILFEELLIFHEAGWRLLSEQTPDVEQQWELVRQKNRQKENRQRIIRWSISGVAASLLLLLSIHLLPFSSQNSNQVIETKASLATIIEHPQTTVVTRTQQELRPILLSTAEGKTTTVHARYLDYTQTTATATQAPSAPPTEWLTLTTPRGKNIKVLLADSTEIWLNAESRLSYPSQFTDSLRSVYLEGEAYFKVAHNPEKPFIVNHHSTTTRALGTEFNIRSYENEELHHVTLIEGKVLIVDTLSQQKEILLPGQDAAYNSSSDMIIKEVNTQEFTAWKEDLFYFEQKELLELMQTLGRWYNTTIAFEDDAIKHYRFTFWAKRSDDLKTTLTMLNQIGTVKIRLNIAANQVVISKR